MQHQDVSRENAVVVYTDGSALSNGKAGCLAGIGVFFGEDDPATSLNA